MSYQILFRFAARGDLDRVIKEVEDGADVNMIFNGKTTLAEASRAGHHLIVKYLIDKGANLNHETRTGQPLFQAVSGSKIECVKVLLEAGVDINITHAGQTLLNVVEDTEILKLLIKAGLNINVTDKKKRTELHNSIILTETVVVSTLLENGINIDAVDCKGRTALHYAVKDEYEVNKNGRVELNLTTIKTLLKYNPDNTIKDNKGKLAIDYAKDRITIDLLSEYQYIDPELKEPDEKYNV